jgi:hypothetical protein
MRRSGDRTSESLIVTSKHAAEHRNLPGVARRDPGDSRHTGARVRNPDDRFRIPATSDDTIPLATDQSPCVNPKPTAVSAALVSSFSG